MRNNKTLKFSLILIFAFIFYCKIAVAAAPTYDNLPTIINLTEDARLVFYVNATDADVEYPLIFSDDSETKLPVFNMVNFNESDNNRRAIINFTPVESDVLDANSNVSNYHITIIVKDSTFETTAQDVLFNITNVNDPPNVTSFTPPGMAVAENASITFSFDNDTADPDLTHPGEDYITNAWYLNGTNTSTNVSWSYTPGFCNASSYNVTLVVNDSYKNSTSVSQILTVTNVNRPPVNNATIQNLTWQQDNNLTNNFTLAGYFNDSDNAECSGLNKDNLTYGYTSYGVNNSINSSKSVNVSIDQTTGNVSFYVEEKWYGVETIAFYVNDSYNITYSNNITLNVTNINDAPVLAQINNQTPWVNILFTLQVNATDPDNDTLYYYSNNSLIVINLTTGIINFTPIGNDTGNYTVNITVNDSSIIDSQIVIFSIINNTPPVLDPIGNQNGTRNSLFQLNLTATDADGDNLTFTSNSTLSFSIAWYNESMSQINFTPALSDVGNHSIEFTVNDSREGTDSEIIIFVINDSNHAPILNESIKNVTWRQDKNLTNNITLSEYFHDIDGDNLIYNVTGNVNITIVINQTTANVSFYPDPGWFGIEYIRFYANDSYYRLYSNNITLNVTQNKAPVIHNIYPYGNWTSLIYNWTTPSLYPDGVNISLDENTTETFKQNSTDADNDNLTYQWLLNGSLVNTTQNLTFYFNFTVTGRINLTAKVTDGLNTSSFSWHINITNINRPPEFGIKTYTDQSDFSGGTLNNTNITVQPGNITLRQSGGVYLNGTYISPAINIGADADKLNFTYISWIPNLPAGTNITLKTRTASASAGLSSASWSSAYSNSARSVINSTNYQYIQFMAALTTNDNTKTPVLQAVNIRYDIATPQLLEDYIYENWIDLDNYFQELDTGDNLIFNHSDASNINITIDQDDHTVKLSFTANWFGTETVQFWANDSYSAAYSNNITIVVQDVTDVAVTSTTIISGGGGGGGVSRTKIKKVPEYEYTRLLVPGPVSVIETNKVKIPIIVENNIDQPLADVYLFATSEEGVSLEFDASFIDGINLDDKKTVNLFATATGKNEPYTITVKAEVLTPSLNDSTLIQINPLVNITTKIRAVMDMLKTYPECLELNELVVNAKKAISNQEYSKANNLLEEALSSCRFILTKEGIEREEKPSPKVGILVWSILILILITAIVSFYLVKREKQRTYIRRGEREMEKRREVEERGEMERRREMERGREMEGRRETGGRGEVL